jgi:hypothetical protein
MKTRILNVAMTCCFASFPAASLFSGNIEPLVRIPFITNGYQTYLELQINGSEEKLCFGFDTGAGSTVLDQDFVISNNVVLSGEKEEMATSTNVVQADISTNNSICLNGFNIKGIKFYIENLSHLNTAPDGKRVAGIIGSGLMRNYVTYINHEENYIELYPKGTELFNNAAEIPFFLYENELPVFYASIKTKTGELPARLVFDSGASFTSSLSSNYISKHKLVEQLKVKVEVPVIGGALSSSSINYLSSLQQLSFGDFTFDHVPVNFSTSSTGSMANDSIDGVIGFDLIKKFNVVLDYEAKKMRLIPNKQYDSVLNFNLTGLSFRTQNDKVVVAGVMDYSPAKSAGIKKGDIVISVDNNQFKSSAELRNYLKGSYKTMDFLIEREGKLIDFNVKPSDFY